MTAVRIARLDRGGFADWDSFVRATPQAGFFHLSGWKSAIEESFGHDCPYLMALSGERVAGVLPLVHVKSRLFGSALISTGFSVHGGPVAAGPDSAAALDDAARALAEERGVDYLEYRGAADGRRGWPSQEDLHAGFRKRLPGDPEALFASIPRKRRAELRKALSLHMEIVEDADEDGFYRLYARNMHRHGTPPLPRRWFRSLKRSFGRDCSCTIIRAEGAPVSGVIAFRFRDAVLPYYAGADESARRLRAFDLMYWHLMRGLSEAGGGEFDFGRSKAGTGGFAYKRSWGFEPSSLRYEYLLLRRSRMPNLNPLNPRYRMLIEVWKRLPLALANLLGPPIARGLG